METHVADPALFGHIRIVIGMVISLSLARLLTGLALFIQHPGRNKVYWVHLGWTLSLFIFILHFWWWEFRLQSLPEISFGIYLFLIKRVNSICANSGLAHQAGQQKTSGDCNLCLSDVVRFNS